MERQQTYQAEFSAGIRPDTLRYCICPTPTLPFIRASRGNKKTRSVASRRPATSASLFVPRHLKEMLAAADAEIRCFHWPVLCNKHETFRSLQEFGWVAILCYGRPMSMRVPLFGLRFSSYKTSRHNSKRIDAIFKCKSKVDAVRALLVMVESINIDCRLSLRTRDVALAYRIGAQWRN